LYFIAQNKDSIEASGKYFFQIDWKKNTVKIDGRNVKFNEEINFGKTKYKVIPNFNYNKESRKCRRFIKNCIFIYGLLSFHRI
jgi:hypothetical protein